MCMAVERDVSAGSGSGAPRQSLHDRGTDSVDPLRCKRLTFNTVYNDSFCCVFTIVSVSAPTAPLTLFCVPTVFESAAPDTSGDFFCGDIDGVPLGQRGVLPGPTQINCRAFRANEGVERAQLDPCCRERALIRTPRTIPRTPTHSYLKFAIHIIGAYQHRS